MKIRTIITDHERVRRRSGYSVTGLAKAVGFSHAYVSQIEGGDRRPSSRYRTAASLVLQVPENQLFPEG
jgi:transcriptional regulator with XRE-family HTH domain